MLIWLGRKRPAVYPFVRTTMLLASGFALVGYLAFPTAPLRISGLGIADTVSGHLPVNPTEGLSAGSRTRTPPCRACTPATPSSRARRCSRRGITWSHAAGTAYPALVVLVNVATGTHIFLDAGAGALVDLVAVGLTLLLQSRAAAPAISPPLRTASVDGPA